MFQPIEENVSVYKKVVAQIQEMIMHGELKKGDRLPPERQLAEMLGVGRPALKQAISALEVLGIIRSRQGAGACICTGTRYFRSACRSVCTSGDGVVPQGRQ